MNTNEQAEAYELFRLTVEGFTDESQATHKIITEVATKVSTLTARFDEFQKQQDRQKPMPVDTRSIENMIQKCFADLKAAYLKKIIIAGCVMFLVMVLTIGVSLSLWSENNLLQGEALKFRMIRQVNPSAARWADSVYYKDPDAAALVTEKAEEAQQVLEQAETDATQKQQEAEQARQKADRLKEKK